MLLATAEFIVPAHPRRVTLTWSAIVLLLVAVIPSLQFAGGLIVFSGDAWMTSIYLLGLTLAYVLGVQLGSSSSRAQATDILSTLFLIAAVISSFLGLMQWLGIQGLNFWLMEIRPGGRPYANITQPNNFATLLCLGLAGLLYLRAKGYLGNGVSGLIALVLFSGIALSQSRASVLILFVITAWIFWKRKRVPLRLATSQILLGLGLSIGFWLAYPIVSDALNLSDSSLVGAELIEHRMSNDGRLVMWTQLIEAALHKPMVGYGWNQVSMAQITVAAEYPHAEAVQQSHNFILDLLVSNGLLLGGALTLLIGWWIISRTRSCTDLESWFALLVIGAVTTHALVEFPHEYAYFLLPLGLCAGLVDATHHISRLTISRRWLQATVAIGWLALGVTSLDYLRLEEDFRRLRFESIGIEARRPPEVTTSPIVLSQLSEFIRFARTEARPDMTEDQLAWMERVAHRYPHMPSLFRYALALGLNGYYDEASLELQRLARLHPPVYLDDFRANWAAAVAHYPTLANVTPP